MPKLPIRIEVVRSTIIRLSSMSEVSALAIVTSLSEHYEDVRLTNVDSPRDVAALVDRHPDLVFLGMNFVIDEANHGAKIWLSDELDKNAIRFTGSGKFAHRLGLNKHLAKQRMIESNLDTASFMVVRREDEKIANEGTLQFPLFVKPSDKGGGQGIDEQSIVRNIDQLRAKIDLIHTIDKTDALVEEYLDGREFSVAIIANHHSSELTAMPIELIATKDSNGERMLSNFVKSSNAEETMEVADLTERIELATFAANVFAALGARDYGRIDIRLDSTGAPHFLEANLIPSLIDGYGSFPKACKLNLNLGYQSMLMQIVRLALDRDPKKIPTKDLDLAF